MPADDIQRDLDALNTSSSDANVPQSEDMQNDISTASDSIQADPSTQEQQAQAIIDRFLEWATDPRLAVLDTETTGLDAGDQVIEIGIVDAYGRTLMNQRIKPSVPIMPGAQDIHGISMADLEGCPTFDQVWPQLKEILWTYDVVIYNKEFDLARLCDSMDASMPGWFQGDGKASELLEAWWALCKRTGCAMQAYAPIHGQWHPYFGSYTWARLSDACADQSVDTSDLKPHHALSDAMATLRLIHAAAKLNPETLTWIGREDEG